MPQGSLTLTVGATVTAFASTVVSAFPSANHQGIRRRCLWPHTISAQQRRTLFHPCSWDCSSCPPSWKWTHCSSIWLVDVPPYTSAFCRLCLIAACGELLNTVLAIGIHATGQVFRISLISGTIYLLELPPCGCSCATQATRLPSTRCILRPCPPYSLSTRSYCGIRCGNSRLHAFYGAESFSRSHDMRVVCRDPCCRMRRAGTWLRLAACLSASSATLCALTWLFILPADAKFNNPQTAHMGKISILFCINHMNTGGVEKSLLALLRTLPRDRFEPHVAPHAPQRRTAWRHPCRCACTRNPQHRAELAEAVGSFCAVRATYPPAQLSDCKKQRAHSSTTMNTCWATHATSTATSTSPYHTKDRASCSTGM